MHCSPPDPPATQQITTMSTVLKSSRLFAFCLMVAAALGGCASSSLQGLHDTYRSEFQANLDKSPAFTTAENGAAALRADQFPVTLSAIASFRQKHPSLDNANKHLAVLEAMIYLQTGRYGQARLARKTAADMGSVSLRTYGGGLTRDELLFQAMQKSPGLIEGWEYLDNTSAGTKPGKGDVLNAANNMAALARDSAVAEGDDGRIYLASTASLLYLRQMDDEAVIAKLKGEDPKPIYRKYGKIIVDILEPHLQPHEIASSTNDATDLSKWAVRYRYVRIYQIGKAYSEK